MAKGNKGRIRVFFAEIDSDDGSMGEGLRLIANAVAKTFQPSVVRVPTESLHLAGPQAVEDLEEEATENVLDGEFEPARPSRSRGKRKPPAMNVVKDLNLRPDGCESLREFYDMKQPGTQLEQVTTFVYYLTEVAQITGVTPHHVYTCFQDLGERSPNDLPDVIRKAANVRGWVDTANSRDLKMTMPGKNYVQHSLPRSSGKPRPK